MTTNELYACTCQAEGWISEKLTVATDESYRDPTNLQSKLQKHQAFEAELSANKGRVDSVTEVRERLQGKGEAGREGRGCGMRERLRGEGEAGR